MRTILLYLLQLIISSGILYGYYHFFLRNKRFHQYNRYYLLAAVIISIAIPFLRIPIYVEESETNPFLLQTLTAISSKSFEEDNITADTAPVRQSLLTLNNILSFVYVFVGLVLFTRFLLALFKIARMTRIYPKEQLDNIQFINTADPATPFSFFRWLFWNKKIELNSDSGQQIFRHELFHIRQKHSWDIVFFEIIAIIFWFNPFYHIIKKEIKAIHEFLADKFAVEENKEWDYAELLLMQVLGTPTTRLTNPFFHNQIKRRITMLTTSKKPGYQYLRKLMVLPLTAITVALFAFTYKNKANNKTIRSEKPITVVVDAGHGGTDPGAKSPDEKYKEAQLSLELAKAVKAVARDYNITVVLSREDDKFPGAVTDKNEALRKRVALSTEMKADAFISLHLSATPDEKNQSKYSGFEAYISKKRDATEDKLLASAILQNLSSLYKTSTEARIRNHTGIYVLDQSTCPAILLECGFINNTDDIKFITDKSNQEKIARRILEGVVEYENAKISRNTDYSQLMVDTVPSIKKVTTGDSLIIKADSIIFHSSKDKIKNDSPPLYVIDGVVMREKNLLSKIAPDKIESVTVLKGKSSTDKYGKDGGNGVIEIKTKKESESPAQKDNILKEVVVVGYRTNQTDNKPVFEKVEVEPSFPGGDVAWRRYLERNTNSMVPVDKGAPAGTYKVMVQYIVKDDGSIYDVKALTFFGYGMEAEAIRVLENSPAWLPAIQNGKKVNAFRKQPITFIVEEEKNNSPEKNEIIVAGYAKDPSKRMEEVKVVGYGTTKPNKVKEVTVIGYPTREGVKKEKQ